MNKNNESFGISVENYLCDRFMIKYNHNRKYRLNPSIKKELDAYNYDNLILKTHNGAENTSVDFFTDSLKTVSVKTNKKGYMQCPQKIGQSTKQKILNYFNCGSMTEFKKLVLNFDKDMILSYLQNLFCCDYLIYINADLGMMTFIKTGPIKLNFDVLNFKASKRLIQWKESNLLKINNKNFMEFQIHNNRNCIKCRFDMRTIIYLIKYDILQGLKIHNKIDFSFVQLRNNISEKQDLNYIKKCIETTTNKSFKDTEGILDLYSGDGEFSKFCLENGISNVISNDYRPHSFVLSNVLTNKNIDIDKCEKILDYMNDLDTCNSDLLIYKNNGYLSKSNSLLVDSWRIYLENLKNEITTEEYFLILKSILYSVCYVDLDKSSDIYNKYIENILNKPNKKLKLKKELLFNLNKNVDLNHMVFNNKPYDYTNYSEIVYLKFPNYYDFSLLNRICDYTDDFTDLLDLKIDKINLLDEICRHINCSYFFFNYSSNDNDINISNVFQVLSKYFHTTQFYEKTTDKKYNIYEEDDTQEIQYIIVGYNKRKDIKKI